jgi:hypothetical protein
MAPRRNSSSLVLSPEPGQALSEIVEKPLCVVPVLEAGDGVIRVTHDDHVAGRVSAVGSCRH